MTGKLGEYSRKMDRKESQNTTEEPIASDNAIYNAKAEMGRLSKII